MRSRSASWRRGPHLQLRMHLLSQLRSRDERRVPELRRRAGGAAETYVVGPHPDPPRKRGREETGLRNRRHNKAERVGRQGDLRDLRPVRSKHAELIARAE